MSNLSKHYENEIRRLSFVTETLLSENSIKYVNWDANADHSTLNLQAGVYHFYETNNGQIKSLYVGKASFGDKGDWSLFQRLKQHFQVSQKNTILGKYAKANKLSMESAKSKLQQSDVFLQWLPIEMSKPINLERELMRIECFCKSILNPVYTDE